MKGHRIEIDEDVYILLCRRFKEDLVVYSCCTDMDGGYIMTKLGLDPLEAPFIECEMRWDTYSEDMSCAKKKFFLYIASSNTSIN